MFRQKFLTGAATAALLTSMVPAFGQSSSDAAAVPASSPDTVVAQNTVNAAPKTAAAPTGLETVTVTAQMLDQARAGIQTQLGASTYTITAQDILNLPGG